MLVKFIISIKSERIDKSKKRNPQVFTTQSSIQSIHSRWNRCYSLELFGWLQQWMNEFILFNILKQQILMNIKLAFPWVWTFDFCISIHGLSIARYYIQYIRLQSCSCRRNGRFSKRKEQKSRKRCKRKSYVSISWRKWNFFGCNRLIWQHPAGINMFKDVLVYLD